MIRPYCLVHLSVMPARSPRSTPSDIRPRDSGAGKRSQVLSRALRTFLEYGYSDTTMDLLAERCRVSKQTIYNNFQDKEALFRAVVDKLASDLFTEKEASRLAGLEPPAYLQRVALLFFERMDRWEHQSFFRLVIAESSRFPELVALYMRKSVEPATGMLASYFQSHPELGLADPEVAARVFRGALASFTLGQEILRGKSLLPLPRERFVRALLDLMLSGRSRDGEPDRGADDQRRQLRQVASMDKKLAEVRTGKTGEAPDARLRLSAKKHEQVLRGALSTFLQYGYKGTSMDKVSSEAGVSKQTVYSHFKDKQALFKALVEKLGAQLFTIDSSTELMVLDPAPFLAQFARSYLSTMDNWEQAAFSRLMIAESPRFPELSQMYLLKAVEPGTSLLAGYFRAHAELAVTDPEATARVFFSALSSFALGRGLLQEKHTAPLPPDRFVHSLVEMVLEPGRR